MLRTLLSIHKHQALYNSRSIDARYFYKWLIIMFNGVDESRVKKYGADRACAEWLLRNGASVRWKGSDVFLKDYNSLPDEKEKFYITAIDATDSAIHHIGFKHFYDCKHIEEIKLVKCSYIENEALSLLSTIKNSLRSLEVIDCLNITDEGLYHLQDLKGLISLKLGGFPYVKNKDDVMGKLVSALPKCKINYI